VCQDVEGDHLQAMEDMDQHMKNLIVELLADAGPEMRKGSFARDIAFDAGIGAVRTSALIIAEDTQKKAHVLKAVDSAEEVQQEETRRVVTRWTGRGITMGHHRADKRKIDQRSDHFGIPAAHIAVGQDLDETFFEAVF